MGFGVLMGAGLGFGLGLFLGAMGDMTPIQHIKGRQPPQAPLDEMVRILVNHTPFVLSSCLYLLLVVSPLLQTYLRKVEEHILKMKLFLISYFVCFVNPSDLWDGPRALV